MARPRPHPPLLLLLCSALLPSLLTTGCDSALDVFVVERAWTPPSSWQPEGERLASPTELESAVIPEPDRFATIHGGLRSADEVSIAYAPVFEATFTAEARAFLPEGPSFDSDGNLYITPLFAPAGTDLGRVLIALDGKSGERLFDVGPGQLGQGGAPLVLHDPDTGEEIIYTGGYRQVMAVDRQGVVLWSTGTQLAVRSLKGLHLYGLQYHPATDTILSVYGSGAVVAFDRRTGARLGAFQSPGAPSKASAPAIDPLIADAFSAALAEGFDLPNVPGIDYAGLLIDALLGGGNIIANYFAVDPDSSRIWLASTLTDEADGTVDGEAELGALYGIDLTRSGSGVSFGIHCAAPFAGGTAATPSVLPGGERVYTADSNRNVLAIDRDCNALWSVDVGEQVFGSLGVSSVGGEIYAATGRNVLKLRDLGDRGEIVWRADLAGAYRERALRQVLAPLVEYLQAALEAATGTAVEFTLGPANLDLAGVGENGVMIQTGFGLGVELLDGFADVVPLISTMTLLDRETGRPINSTRAVEESVAVISTGPGGETAIGNSPVRRLFLRGLVLPLLDDPDLPPLMRERLMAFVPPATGGVTKYAPVRAHHLLARDASCGAARRLRNTLDYADTAATDTGVRADERDALRLIAQARQAADSAEAAGELSPRRAARLRDRLDDAGTAIETHSLATATINLRRACLIALF